MKAITAGIALATSLLFSAPAWSATACTHEDFYLFLEAFQNNPSEQENMSADQIEMTTVHETDSGMPARHTQTQSKNDLDWPVLPSLTALNQQDFRVRIYQNTPLKAELYATSMDGPEVFLLWYFEKNPCWSFVGFEDGTLHH